MRSAWTARSSIIFWNLAESGSSDSVILTTSLPSDMPALTADRSGKASVRKNSRTEAEAVRSKEGSSVAYAADLSMRSLLAGALRGARVDSRIASSVSWSSDGGGGGRIEVLGEGTGPRRSPRGRGPPTEEIGGRTIRMFGGFLLIDQSSRSGTKSVFFTGFLTDFESDASVPPAAFLSMSAGSRSVMVEVA